MNDRAAGCETGEGFDLAEAQPPHPVPIDGVGRGVRDHPGTDLDEVGRGRVEIPDPKPFAPSSQESVRCTVEAFTVDHRECEGSASHRPFARLSAPHVWRKPQLVEH